MFRASGKLKSTGGETENHPYVQAMPILSFLTDRGRSFWKSIIENTNQGLIKARLGLQLLPLLSRYLNGGGEEKSDHLTYDHKNRERGNISMEDAAAAEHTLTVTMGAGVTMEGETFFNKFEHIRNLPVDSKVLISDAIYRKTLFAFGRMTDMYEIYRKSLEIAHPLFAAALCESYETAISPTVKKIMECSDKEMLNLLDEIFDATLTKEATEEYADKIENILAMFKEKADTSNLPRKTILLEYNRVAYKKYLSYMEDTPMKDLISHYSMKSLGDDLPNPPHAYIGYMEFYSGASQLYRSMAQMAGTLQYMEASAPTEVANGLLRDYKQYNKAILNRVVTDEDDREFQNSTSEHLVYILDQALMNRTNLVVDYLVSTKFETETIQHLYSDHYSDPVVKRMNVLMPSGYKPMNMDNGSDVSYLEYKYWLIERIFEKGPEFAQAYVNESFDSIAHKAASWLFCNIPQSFLERGRTFYEPETFRNILEQEIFPGPWGKSPWYSTFERSGQAVTGINMLYDNHHSSFVRQSLTAAFNAVSSKDVETALGSILDRFRKPEDKPIS